MNSIVISAPADGQGHEPEASPAGERPQDGRRPYIEFKHVFKAFGSNRVLDDVSFDVLPGETVCILGRSGVGKSVSLGPGSRPRCRRTGGRRSDRRTGS